MPFAILETFIMDKAALINSLLGSGVFVFAFFCHINRCEIIVNSRTFTLHVYIIGHHNPVYLFDRVTLVQSINDFIAIHINIYIDYSSRPPDRGFTFLICIGMSVSDECRLCGSFSCISINIIK